MTKMLKTKSSLLLLILITLLSCEKESGLPRDGDGNVYDTVRIGTQVWLAENLKTTKYNNGISIPLVTDNNVWISKTSAAFCWYNNQPENFKDDFGGLYNWWAVQVRALCPVGYHVPTDEEWTILIDYLGGEGWAGQKLKEPNTKYWIDMDECSTNESGFSARAGGGRSELTGEFAGLRTVGWYWASSETAYPNNGTRIELYDQYCGVYKIPLNYKCGISVRCIKDNP